MVKFPDNYQFYNGKHIPPEQATYTFNIGKLSLFLSNQVIPKLIELCYPNNPGLKVADNSSMPFANILSVFKQREVAHFTNIDFIFFPSSSISDGQVNIIRDETQFTITISAEIKKQINPTDEKRIFLYNGKIDRYGKTYKEKETTLRKVSDHLSLALLRLKRQEGKFNEMVNISVSFSLDEFMKILFFELFDDISSTFICLNYFFTRINFLS